MQDHADGVSEIVEGPKSRDSTDNPTYFTDNPEDSTDESKEILISSKNSMIGKVRIAVAGDDAYS